MNAIRPRAVETFVLRIPCEPVMTPFGYHRGRQSVLVRITDDEGAVGWGEAWCNYPSGIGAEHRAGLIDTVLAPILLEGGPTTPSDAFATMTRNTHLLSVQSGESGPIAQAIAGVDIALWDLAARKAGQPLWKLLGGTLSRVPVYASGLSPDHARQIFPSLHQQGYRALKIRIWGGDLPHAETLRSLRDLAGPGFGLMADANQSWSADQAVAQLRGFDGLDLDWLEEPIVADAPDAEWKQVRGASPVPLSGGENIRGEDGFAHALALGALDVVQPDMCKWGGFSGCLPLARRIMAAGRRYCPHYLGGGIGLLASAHLLAAAGGDGLLELDMQDNPLRDRVMALSKVEGGDWILPNAPGLGPLPDADAITEYRGVPI